MSIYDGNNRYASVCAYYAVRMQQFSMTQHVHEHCEIMYVSQGECTVYSDGKKYILGERQFVFIDKGVFHSLEVQPDKPCVILNLEFSCLPHSVGADISKLRESAYFREFVMRKQAFVYSTDCAKLGHALKDLISELEKRPQLQGKNDLLLTRVLYELAECPPKDGRGAGAPHIRKALEFISKNLYEEISVADVAEYVGINSAYLQTLFSRSYGCGIVAYINTQRLEHACFLLKNSSLSIVDIAFRLGYNSRQHFGYLFNKRFGMSPKHYRSIQGQGLSVTTDGCQISADEDGIFRVNKLID